MRLNLYLTQEILYPKEIKQDLTLRAKNTNIIDTFYYDENDNSIDITGDTIFFTIKNNPTDTDESAVLKKTITDLTDPSNGEAEIELSSTDTSSLLGNYLYDIKIKHDEKFYTVSEGNICFQKSLTIRES